MRRKASPWPRRFLRLSIVASLMGFIFFSYQRILQLELPILQSGDPQLPVGVYHLTSAASRAVSHPLRAWANIAAQQDVDFIVITDPGEQLAGPAQYDSLAVLSAAELSTPFGRVVQLGATGVLHPEARERFDVLQSIRALQGTPLISHLGDPKIPWNGPLEDAGGVEIASFTSSMRRRAGRILLGAAPALLASQLRPQLAMAQLYDRDERALRRWDEERRPSVIGICGADTSGLLPPKQNLSSWRLVLNEPLDDESDEADGIQFLERIRNGRFYCAAAVFSPRPYFRFGALARNEWIARPGDTVSVADVTSLIAFGPSSSSSVPPTLVLLRNGEEVLRVVGTELRYEDPLPGTYRVEVRVRINTILLGERVSTVIYSNRIRLEADNPSGDRELNPRPASD